MFRQACHYHRVELRSGALSQFDKRRGDGEPLFVRAGRYDRVEGIRDPYDTCFQRDMFSPQPIGVSGTIKPLMVMEYSGEDIPKLFDRGQDGDPLFRMESHGGKFLFRKGGRFFQQRLDNTDFPDVV